jgi:hypothetical protein
MAFSTDTSADDAVVSMRLQAKSTRAYMTSQKAAFQAIRGQVIKEFTIIVQLVQHIDVVLVNMDQLVATLGIAASYQALTKNPAADIVADYNNWRAAMSQMRTDLAALFPATAFTNPQVQTLSADMDAVNATISS